MSNGYGISKWEDAKTIYNELHELTSKPIYCVSEEALKDLSLIHISEPTRH